MLVFGVTRKWEVLNRCFKKDLDHITKSSFKDILTEGTPKLFQPIYLSKLYNLALKLRSVTWSHKLQ